MFFFYYFDYIIILQKNFLQFRLCKFTIISHKSMYLCQEECVANYRSKSDQCILKKKCEQCQSAILDNEDKSYVWLTKHLCSVDCLSE